MRSTFEKFCVTYFNKGLIIFFSFQSLKRSFTHNIKVLETKTENAIAELHSHGLSQEGKEICTMVFVLKF